MLGIELATRRRNRLSARVTSVDSGGFGLAVLQTFGNCPQYIQAREFEVVERGEAAAPELFTALADEHRQMIHRADTFFVASASGARPGQAVVEGVDVSHRGGRPGFVQVEDNGTLVIPDYAGNNHFNTLGNFQLYPRAGLLFVDFEPGDLLSLTGHSEILWDAPDVPLFEGAQRFWTFRVEEGVLLRAALPLRTRSLQASPDNTRTGDWQDVARKRSAMRERERWHRARVVRVEEESRDIRSFYLVPEGVAEQAVVSFVDAAGTLLAEQAWTQADVDLLGFAETHGLQPEFACRRGQCGSCRAGSLEGEVVQVGAAESGDDGVLLCCARPAERAGEAAPRLRIRLS